MRRALLVVCCLAVLAGCLPGPNEMIESEKKAREEREKAAAAATEKKSIMHQTTQDITEYDPAAGREISDLKIEATDPVLGPLQAYGPMAGKIAVLGVDQNLALFYATEGRYPNDFREFMDRIIVGPGVRLPVLPGKHEYQYDVASHQLLIVKPLRQPAAAAAP